MKRLISALITFAVILLASTCIYADSGATPQQTLARFDFDIVGVGLKADPLYQAVPKGIATKVNAVIDAGNFNVTDIVAQLPKEYTVRAELSGPAFQKPMALVTRPGVPFDIPTLAITGRYTLANIRLVDGNGVTLFGSIPQVVAIESIPDPLITSVTTRQLTVQELKDRGVTFDSSNFTAYQFTAGIATSSGQVPLTLPVVIPTSQSIQQTPEIIATSPISLPVSGSYEKPPEVPETVMPKNLVVEPFLMQVEDSLGGAKVQLPPIPGVVVIPGNIGFLHQYFSALTLVSNGAPLQSGLSIRDVTTKVSFPAGEDLIPGTDASPGDDPLRMAKGTNGYFPRTLPILNAGADGKPGTADDSGVMQPGESGQADFTIEGMKEGTHKVDFDITATLDGLPIGPVTIKGKASGAVLVRNPDFAVTLGHPATVRAGELYDLFITVTNTGLSIANLVTVSLDPRALSGATFVDGESNSKSIETILSGSAATVRFRLKSQRTGKVTANAFESPDVKGRFILRAGVGENNIPLSPDSLILPYTGGLTSDLTTAAVGLLGQAWSVATAPSGALPATVLPISKSTVSSRAYELSEAGLRVLIGDTLLKAAQDLTFDLFGSDVYNKGFDSLRRSSTMGLEVNRALADIYKTGVDSIGVSAFQAAFADKVSYRPAHLSIVVGDAPLRMQLSDAAGNKSGSLDGTTINRAIPYADSFSIGENGSTRTNLMLATRIDSPSYSVELLAEGVVSSDMAIVMPDVNGVLAQYIFSALSLPSGAKATLSIIPASGNLTLQIDDNADGVVDRTVTPSTATLIPDHATHIVAATQLVPDFGPGGDKHGRTVAVLFSERVGKDSTQNPLNYSVDENLVKQAVIQPGNRMAFLLLRDGIGPFYDRSLTVREVADTGGKAMSAPETIPIRITAKGPAAVVTGTVRTAKGESVPNATVRLYQLIWYTDPYTKISEPRYALFTEKTANSDGSYRLEYVLQNDPTGVDPSGPFQIEVINPASGEVGSLITGVTYHGQHIKLDIFMKAKGGLSGVVRNDSGSPVGGATVQVNTLADDRRQSVISDAAGAYSFSNLMVGAFSVTAVHTASFSQGSTMGTLPENGSAVVQDIIVRRVADLSTGTVSGRVLNPDGVTPRPGGLVIIKAPNYETWQRADTNGNFSFKGVYAGGVNLIVRDDVSGEQNEVNGTLFSGANLSLNVIMPGTGTVAGVVTRDDGKSAEGLYIIATFRLGTTNTFLNRLVRSDAIGQFSFPQLPIGAVNIRVLDPRDFNRTVATGDVSILSAGEVANIALFVPLKAFATGTIQGVVRHRDGRPWANAPLLQIVDDNSYYQRTVDGEGKFSIPSLALGNYRFSVVGGVEVVNVITDLWYDTQVRTLDFVALGLGTVTGTTWDDAGKTIPTGADVTLTSMKPNQVGWLVLDSDFATVVKSDPQSGRFIFTNVLQGNFIVSTSNIFRPTAVTATGKIEANGQVVNFELALKGSPPKPGEPPPVNQPGSVSGQVLMPDGSKGGKDIRVTITFGGADVTVTTNDQGQFSFAPIIPSGNKTIIAEDPVTTLKWRGSVSVPSGLDVPVTIKLLGRGSVTVKVVSAGGAAVSDANVQIGGIAYPNDSGSAISDAAGVAVFNNLSEGNYALSAVGTGAISGLSGRNQAFIPADMAAVTAEVHLAPSATVTGHFMKADGITPIGGGQVTLRKNGQVIAYASSSSDPADIGRFRMEYVPLGDFSLEGYDPLTERRGVGGGRLSTDAEIVNANVVVTPRGTVKGVVLNYGGTAPIVGAPVSITVSGVANFSYSSVTAPDGSFFYSGVPAGRWTVDATDPSNALRGLSSGTLSYENESVTTQVRIAPTGSISGRVLMPDGVTVAANTTVRLNGGTPLVPDATTGEFNYYNLAAGSSYTLSSIQSNTRRVGSGIATINRDLEVANGNIILGGIGSVKGVVFEPDGVTPLFGAKVELQFGGTTLIDYTTESGNFNFVDIPTGPFTLKASHTLRSTGASRSGYLRSEAEIVNFDLVLGEIGSIKATVLLADGVTPSRGGGIRISTNTGRILTGLTDSNGQYTFTSIPVPCTVSLYVEDAAGLGIGRAYGTLEHNGQLLDFGVIVLDDKPIYVTSVDPSSGAVNQPIDKKMRVLFSEKADPATLVASNIYLMQGSSRVVGSLAIDADGSGITFVPTVPLKGFALYNMVVSDGVTDLVGRKLALPQSISFTTVDNIPPALNSVSPTDGAVQIANDAVIRLNFSEALDSSTLANIQMTVGGISVSTRTDLIQGGTVVAITALEPLAYNRTYNVTASGVKDSVGNLMVGTQQFSFSTIDTIAPTVTALSVPATADLIKGNSVPVTTTVADSDVAFVDFYLDELVVGSVNKAPYTLPVMLPREGVAHLKAIAQDRVGNRGASVMLDLNVTADQPPHVSFVTPLEGGSVNTGGSFTVSVQGGDDLGIKEFILAVSGEMIASKSNTVAVAKNATSTFILNPPTTITGSGGIVLTLTARDSGGALSAPVVRNIILHDSIAPTISLTSPGVTAKYKPGETASVNLNISDNMGATRIVCNAYGAATATQSFEPPPQASEVMLFSFVVPSGAVPYAVITATCSASDAAGNSSTASINLTVADVIPPNVVSASLVDSAADVPANAFFTFNFNETISAATVLPTTVTIIENATGIVLPASVTISAERKTVTLKPSALLLRAFGYTITLTTSITDDAGNPLAMPYLLRFSCDSAAPTLSSLTPASGSINVPVGSAVSVRFSEQIDPASVTADMISLTSISGAVPGTLSVSADALSLTFKPYNQLGFARAYTFTLKSGVKDVSGNATTADVTATFTTQGPDSDLVGYWPMDGDWTDYSGNGNHLSAYGGVSFLPDRISGVSSVRFDGSGYAVNTTPAGMNLTGNFTVTGWVKPESGGGIIDRGSEGGAGWEVWYDGASAAITYRHNWNRSTWEALSTPANSVPTGKWSHFAVVYTDKYAKIYINGVEAVVGGFSANPIVSTSDWLEFGANRPGGDEYYKGALDEVYIYKRALLPEDIFEHYNSGLSSDRTPPTVPTVNPVTSPTYSNQVVLRGTKDARSSIRANGKQIVAHDDNTTWQVLYKLALGQNLLDISSRDLAGNASAAVNVVVNLLPANPNDPVATTPVLTLTSPGQAVNFKPGESGTATVTATNPDGIAQIYCNASGAVSEGVMVVSFDPPQASVTQQFTFSISSDSIPYEPYHLSCVAESALGALGSVTLNLQVEDIVLPTVTGSSIADNATGVLATLPVTVSFSETMTPASFTSATVLLQPASGGAPVTLRFILSADGKIATLTPDWPLDCANNYMLTIRGVRDLAGNLLANDFILHFSTQPLISLLIENKGTASAPYTVAAGRYGTITVKNSFVVLDGPVAADSMTVTSNSTITHKATALTGAEKLDLTVIGTLSIDGSSKIDVSGRGYLGAYSGGNNTSTGRTYGNTTTGGSGGSSGGSYGGNGGYYSSSLAAAYGDLLNPNELGSGGGTEYSIYPGGNGGGLVRIKAGTVQLDGSIVADGQGSSYYGGGGSGGGIRIDTGTLSGAGYVYARGGGSSVWNRGGGGGGRIAIYYSAMSLPQSNVVATGAITSYPGYAGTVRFSLFP